MTYDQIATIAASFATCVTAVIILLTLLEMKAQRSMTSRPILVPIRQSVYAYKLENQLFWSETILRELDSLALIRDYPIHIYNLGNGAAMNIKLRWELDILPIIDEVNNLCQKNMSQIFIELHENKWMKISEAGSHKSSINTTLDMEATHDHLLSASIDSKGLCVRIPQTFVTLASYFFIEGGKKLQSDRDSFALKNKPEIKLSITFDDISGEKHTTKFTFSLNLVMWNNSQFTAMLEN